jgi:shikimate kinase
MMGAGKSTIGKLLATQLGYRFVDTDDLIVAYAKESIPAIFAKYGEAYFRELETKVLAEVSSHTRLVVATGGGIVMRDQNWSYLHHGIVIWLDVPLEELWQRLSHSSQPRYAQADITLSVVGEPKVVTQQILAALTDRLKPATQYPGGNTSPQTESPRSPHTP